MSLNGSGSKLQKTAYIGDYIGFRVERLDSVGGYVGDYIGGVV